MQRAMGGRVRLALKMAAMPSLTRATACIPKAFSVKKNVLPIASVPFGFQRRMMSKRADELTPSECPKCSSGNTYFDGVSLFVCPDCSHEWAAAEEEVSDAPGEFKDAFGTPLQNGDSVILSKELKAGSVVLKKGTKVKNIRLGSYGDGHDISCSIPGKGSFHLKTMFVKKA